MAVTRNGKYLDNTGVETLWGLIKAKFQAQESGKGLSTNDYTTAEKTKLAGIATGAEVNVQSDWSVTDTSSDAYIKNKPTSLKNPNALTIGGKDYDGSSAVSVTLSDLSVYSKSEIDSKFSANVKYSVVDELPTTGEDGTIYLVPSSTSATGDIYDEYMWIPVQGSVAAHFEKIGSTKSDFSNYYTKTEVDTSLAAKQDKLAAKGSTTKPIYTSAAGTIAECSTYAGGTAVTLNGTSKTASTASFYAPTEAGTSGYYLKSSGSGAPTWQALSTSPTSGGTTAITSGAVYTALADKVSTSSYLTDAEITAICV